MGGAVAGKGEGGGGEGGVGEPEREGGTGEGGTTRGKETWGMGEATEVTGRGPRADPRDQPPLRTILSRALVNGQKGGTAR